MRPDHTQRQYTRNIDKSNSGQNVFVLGATGTAGRATVNALVSEGHTVTCLVRSTTNLPDGVVIRSGDVSDPTSIAEDGICGDKFDVLVSCLASRTGAPEDAWAIDYQAHSNALKAAKSAGVKHVVLLSAICVQRPRLAFQKAKLAFEEELIHSGLTYSIVRPTAFFKSLSGQVERVRRGKPYLMFGNGELTACKPISDEDLGNYMAACITDPKLFNRILPIGGPGPAITPRQLGEYLFDLTGQKPKFQRVPVAMFDIASTVLSVLGRFNTRFEAKAELARIGKYYATESMLVLNEVTGQYDSQCTPSTGKDSIKTFYKSLLDGTSTVSLGEHAMFSDKQ